ncbi:MAG: hypothetical protein R3C52_11995 [Hyphomonadaceae bacterium]
MQVASALLKNGIVFVQAYSETTSGVWIGAGPVHISDINQTGELGKAVRDALELSTRGVPHPSRDEWKGIQQPMLDAVGAKNWSTLAKGARAVGIECQNGLVTMTPSHDYQNDGGTDLPERAIVVPMDASVMGENLSKAFDLCS